MDRPIGKLEMHEFAVEDVGFGWGGRSGIMIISNADDENKYTLPEKIEVSTYLIFNETSLFHVDNYGILSFHNGVLNGWAKYRLDQYDPHNSSFICQLRDGEIVEPKVALQTFMEDLEPDE